MLIFDGCSSGERTLFFKPDKFRGTAQQVWRVPKTMNKAKKGSFRPPVVVVGQ
jgi:hypothetical protein